MEVQNVYQDDQGKWHIDYHSGHLMGLAIRVYWGQFLISIFIGLPVLILAALASAKSLDESKNIPPNSNSSFSQESVCIKPSKYQ